jgi:hypothetical protein
MKVSMLSRGLVSLALRLPLQVQEFVVWYSLREYRYARDQLKQCIMLANKELLKAGGYSLELEYEAGLAKQSLVRAEGLIKTGFSMWHNLPSAGPLVKQAGKFEAFEAGKARDHKLLYMLLNRLEAVKQEHIGFFKQGKKKEKQGKVR